MIGNSQRNNRSRRADDRFGPLALLMATASCLLSASCERRAEPEKVEGAPVPVETAPVPATPPVPSPAMVTEPDWRSRYRDNYGEFLNAFMPPGPGDTIEISFPSGKRIPGTLVSIETNQVVLGVPSGKITYPREMLSKESLATLYARPYAHYNALRAVQKERRAYEETTSTPVTPPPSPRMEKGSDDRQLVVVEPPRNDPEDHSVRQVKDYLRRTLRNPSSLQFLDWSDVIQGDGEYRVVCTYQAQAGNFGVVTEKKVFFMDENGFVTAVSAVRQSL